MKIEDLCQQVVRAMLDAGYTECSAWSRYRDFYSPLISFYHRYYLVKEGIKRIIEFHETGKLYWSAQAKESKFPINEYYRNLLDQFLETEKFHMNTRGDVIWVSKRYFS